MKRNLLFFSSLVIFILAFPVSLMAQTGPGGVGGYEDDIDEGAPLNSLWLRAQDLTLSDGAAVDSWDDISGYGHEAVVGLPANGGIFYEENKTGGFPWVHFLGVNYLKVNDHDVLDGGEGLAIFLVAKRDSFKAEKYEKSSNLVTKRAHWNAWSHVPEISMDAAGLQHAYEIRWDRAAPAPNDSASITAFINGNLPDGAGSDVFPTRENTPRTDTSYLISWAYTSAEGSYGAFVRINGQMTNRPGRSEGNPNPIVVGNVIDSPKDVWIGAAEYDPPGAYGNNESKDDTCPTCAVSNNLEGAISEVIIYKGTLWPTHVHIVENYLSAKYGLPIGKQKYYNDEVCKHDVIGIGNENGDDKKQVRSKSGSLSIEEMNESLDVEKEYVFIGHDGVEIEAITTEGMAVSGAERWGRTWKVEKSGTADISLGFDFIEAGVRMETVSKYRLAYKANMEDDFTLLEVMPSKVLRTLYFELADADLNSGYYTLAYLEGSNNIDDFNISSSMLLYPNPANLEVNILFEDHMNGNAEIRILDYTGREIMRLTDLKTTFSFERTVNLEGLETGTYFVEFRINDHYAIQPLLKK